MDEALSLLVTESCIRQMHSAFCALVVQVGKCDASLPLLRQWDPWDPLTSPYFNARSDPVYGAPGLDTSSSTLVEPARSFSINTIIFSAHISHFILSSSGFFLLHTRFNKWNIWNRYCGTWARSKAFQRRLGLRLGSLDASRMPSFGNGLASTRCSKRQSHLGSQMAGRTYYLRLSLLVITLAIVCFPMLVLVADCKKLLGNTIRQNSPPW